MQRSIAALLAVFVLAISVRADLPAYHAGADKKPAQPAPAEARKKIIAEIDADSEQATDRLNQRDAGAATRARQQRILDNLDELLKQQVPDPNAGASQNPPPQMPMKPTPKPSDGDPNQQPGKAKGHNPQQPVPSPTPGKPQFDKPGPQTELSPWPTRRPGERQQMDSIARERLIRNYEEVLRAYYRNIAESSRRKDAD